MRYTRHELLGIVATRMAAGLAECQGEDAFLIVRTKVTPELLADLMACEIVAPDGKRSRITAIYSEDDGTWTPVLETITEAAAR